MLETPDGTQTVYAARPGPRVEGETAVAVTPPILFVLNWYEELKRLVPTK